MAQQDIQFKSYIQLIGDSASALEKKLKAAQELSENLESVISSTQYSQMLPDLVKVFLRVLQEGEPQFIAELSMQQLRKILLEILHRLPTNELLKPFWKQILTLVLSLLEIENEENVLVCLRIIIELHKTYRPQYGQEVQKFLQFVKNIYKELPSHLQKIFEPRSQIKVKDMTEIAVDTLLPEIFAVTAITTEKRNPDNQPVTFNVIPRVTLSLKVLAELPIIVVLMYQLFKNNVHQEVSEFIPLIMNALVLQPTAQQRSSPMFNKEIFVDFIAAQIKTLSFLAYIIRVYQDIVTAHSQQLVRGMLGLLALCPQEVAHLRKELLIAARHILATELRNKFVPHIERLFDENVLTGGGWTAHDSLRPLAYSTLADLVHHVRTALPLSDLALAVGLFAKSVHDETLPSNIQTMSCKLLLNLVEGVKQKSDQENGTGRELLMKMLEVCVLRFKVVAEYQLPVILLKCKQADVKTLLDAKLIDATLAKEDAKPALQSQKGVAGMDTAMLSFDKDDKAYIDCTDKEEKAKLGSTVQLSNYSVVDCRSLVKTLVCGVKTITWGIASCKSAGSDAGVGQTRQFQPKETLVFVRLVKYALRALDIYTLSVTTTGQAFIRPAAVNQLRTKEEKEVLEHFAGVFTLMNPTTFREIFSVTIDFVVERIQNNYALQIVANSFLANPSTSASFATILVEYLLARLEDMGSVHVERSGLYLKLFKLVFGSVSLFAAENEQMLKPHLHTIVNRSIELAMTAKEPYNYFLLLRALFRSIGGGSHDLLYQEFLPLLPTLLHSLNSLQSGLHKQHMKDLFVELCLTVPVRLSSLLPYLPMLMDPLVSALNGSQTLISQGLRTLELCVDNLQPEFLYDHIQPVRAELMQALWRCLRSPNEGIAHVAFRVLGKFGGGNRKMLREPQQLSYEDSECDAGSADSPCIIVHFQDSKAVMQLPVRKAIDCAVATLKSSAVDLFYRKQAWEILRSFLMSALSLDDDKLSLTHLLTHPSFTEESLCSAGASSSDQPLPTYHRVADEYARETIKIALSGMFVAAAIKEIQSSVLLFIVSMVRHFVIVAVAQMSGPFPVSGSISDRTSRLQDSIDVYVLVDALALVMGHEEKELCRPGQMALALVLDTTVTILGNKERACQLPLFEYLAEKMCSLCYERAWYAKLGGCYAIKFMCERLSLRWVLQHQFLFLKALLFVMLDLTGEVSSGAIDLSKATLDGMLKACAASLPIGADHDLALIQQKSLHDVSHELVRQVTSPNTHVREQVMQGLRVLAEATGRTVTEVMEPHKEVLQDMIPPKKHLLRHQPANAQIGLMDGNTFCTSLEPRLFTIDLEVSEHKMFYNELVSLCEAEDTALIKLPCYKTVNNLMPLRRSALRALAACHYIPVCREKIYSVLFKALSMPSSELQETAYECMKKLVSSCEIDMEQVRGSMRAALMLLGDHRSLTLTNIQKLTSLIQLFPNSFNEKLCEQLLQHLKKWFEAAATASAQKGVPGRSTVQAAASLEIKTIAAIIHMFHLIQAATSKTVEPLTSLTINGEKKLLVELGSVFREPLLRFLVRFPVQTVELFLSEASLRDSSYTRTFISYLKAPDGKPFRDHLQLVPQRLINLLHGQIGTGSTPVNDIKEDLQFIGVKIISVLTKLNPMWLQSNTQIVSSLLKIWTSESFQERHRKLECVDYVHWKEPKLIVKIMLEYFKQATTEIELLFQMLRCFTLRLLPQYQFFRSFLEDPLATGYPVEWKRSAFFKFVDIFGDQKYTQDMKAKILQHIVIPSFQVSFEKGEGEALIGGPPAPDQDNPENVISVFINKVIDPDNPFGTSDTVRILLLQFSSLLVEQASPHIHDAANKRQGNKLRRLMTFAWPCLLSKSCVDPATRYHGHLLLSHIIAKFAIHKRIVLQVFHSLLKAHASEARVVVRNALDILTPAMPGRMEDGNGMLIHWTKKIIVEEGHAMAQLLHILQLVVRHMKVYYPVRHHLIQHMVTSMQRLAFTGSAGTDQRRLSVDLAEVIIKWELQRVKDETDPDNAEEKTALSSVGTVAEPGLRRSASSGDASDVKKVRQTTVLTAGLGSSGSLPGRASSAGGPVGAAVGEMLKPLEKTYVDSVVNFLLRVACQVNEQVAPAAAAASPAAAAANSGLLAAGSSPGELLSRRCVGLLKSCLRTDVWPNAELKLAWFEKLFLSVEASNPNFTNICTALDLLTFLLSILRKETILASLKPLQRGIAACMTCMNTKVIRAVHSLLSRLMSIFPTEPSTSTVASKYEELEILYACVSKVVYEGLSNYEKSTAGTQLFGTLMILKAACMQNPSYIDRLITSFMRVLQRMAKEHLSPTTAETNNPMASELLILSLDLVKNRVAVMSMEMRKSFIGSILVGLIEKTTDAKVMKAITKMVEDWIKTKTAVALNQSPTLREKAILLVKLMQNVEKRFPTDEELNAQFLELVNYIYRDDSFGGSELTAKLEVAFLSGLRCSQPSVRQKFFDVYDKSVSTRLSQRLFYICSSQNWESMGTHFWIKQCIELVLSVAVDGAPIRCASPTSMLPSATAVVSMADSQARAAFTNIMKMKEEPMDVESIDAAKEEEELEIELASVVTSGDETPGTGITHALLSPKEPGLVPRRTSASAGASADPKQALLTLIAKQVKFLDSCRETNTTTFLNALCQLCHLNTDLAANVWIDLFPRLWKLLGDRQQQALAGEVLPFMCTGSHVVQKEVQPSAANCFFESLSKCVPPVSLRPCITKYLGRTHNLWHRVALILETMSTDSAAAASVSAVRPKLPLVAEYEVEQTATTLQETYDMLSDLYTLLREKDMLTGLWQKRVPKYPETVMALTYEQHGFFEQAQATYEQVTAKARLDLNQAAATQAVLSEFKLWEDHWVLCAKELNQWDSLLEYGNSKGNTNPQLVMDSAWRVPNWSLMKEALAQVESSCPKEMAWKVNLCRGFVAICHPEEQHLNVIEKLVEVSTNLAIKEWRRLPKIVSHAHVPFLQAAQQVMELSEAAQISHGLQPPNIGRANSLHDMKAIVKTWRNRLPIVSDDLSHWGEVFTWRQHHYQLIISHYEQQASSQQDQQATNQSMLGVHASAQAIIHYGKIARKHGLTGVCLDSLSRIHTIPSVPIVDCFQKIRQQVKCYLQMSGVMGKNELQEGLEVIESTNLKYFTKEMTAEFYALKGMFLAQIGRSDDANKAFSAAVQMHDTLVKAWALWGDYLETIFTKERAMSVGVNAMTCFLHACRHTNEGKSRKYLAKVIWLLTYDDDKLSLAEAVEKYAVGVPPGQWLPWIPQLLTCLTRNEGHLILNLITQVGRLFPQAVYFPIRTLYLTLKIEQRDRYKSGGDSAAGLPGAAPMTPVSSMGRSAPPSLLSPLGLGTSDQMFLATSTPAPLLSGGSMVHHGLVQSSQVAATGTSATSSCISGLDSPLASSAAAAASASLDTIPSDIDLITATAVPASASSSSLSSSQTSLSAATAVSSASIMSQQSTKAIHAAPTAMWRCSRIMHLQRDLYPTVLSSLEGIVDQMVWFRENWYEEVLRQLKQGLAKCYAVAFENRGAVSEAAITPHTQNFLKKLVSTFGVGLESVANASQTYSSAASESIARRAQATAQDPVFQKMKSQFTADFDFSVPGSTKLHNLISKLKKWIKILEAKTKLLPKSFLVEEKCRFLSNFSQQTAEIELPGEFLLPKSGNYYVRIARFMPRVEIVHKHNTAARRLYIRGHNGKVYPYLVVNDANLMEARREERVLQLLRMINQLLGKQKQTAQRLLHFTVPRVVPIAPQMRLIEDNPASVSLLDIYRQRCTKRSIEYDAPLTRYYERLASVQQRGTQASHQVLRDILRDVQTNMVPRVLLREWACQTFPDATDYWTFRSMFTVQLALEGLAEFVFHLTRMNPDTMYLHQDSGYLSISYFRFDLAEEKGELDANRPVPFRLTPNIADFITATGVAGPLTASMVAAARCFVQPQYKLASLLRAILRDEMITWHRKKQDDSGIKEPASAVASGAATTPTEMEGDIIINLVTKAVSAITARLQNLATFDGAESRVNSLVAAASNHDNLCRMDPAWHPWL